MELPGMCLPVLSGDLNDDFQSWEYRFLAFLRIHTPKTGHSELNRCDLLQLAMQPHSPAAAYHAQIQHQGFSDRLASLRAKFGSEARVKSRQLAAVNKLALRSFRDGGSNKSEMVDSLLADLSRLFLLADIHDDAEKRAQLGRAFKEFPVVLKLVKNAVSYDDAVLESLRWESLVVQRALKTASQAGAEDRGRARLSLMQKIEHWRGSQDSLVDPTPNKRISEPPTATLPRPYTNEDAEKRMSVTEAKWRYSTLSAITPSQNRLSASAPAASLFDHTALPTPQTTVFDDAEPAMSHAASTANLASQNLEDIPALSLCNTSLASKEGPQTPLSFAPQSLPKDHPYFRVSPVIVPPAYRTNIRLAMTASTYEPTESSDSEEEDFQWDAISGGGAGTPSVTVQQATPQRRRLRRKSESRTSRRNDSLSSSRASQDRGTMTLKGRLGGMFRAGSVKSTEALGHYPTPV